MLAIILHHYFLTILFATGLIAGTVDAIAGGGGLISVPVLLALGVPPHIMLGTNKLQSTVGTLAAAVTYYQKGWVSLRTIYLGLIFGFLGAALGAFAGQLLSNTLLTKIIPILLVCMLAYTIFSPKLGHSDTPAKMRESLFYTLFGFTLGFYDGFFGPGIGSLWVFMLMYFLGHSLIKATAHTKILNFNTNITSLLCFAVGHNVNYHIAIYMAAGQIIGGRLGAHLAIRNGAKLIRPIFIGVVTLTITTLLIKNYSATPYSPAVFALIVIGLPASFYFYLRAPRQITEK